MIKTLDFLVSGENAIQASLNLQTSFGLNVHLKVWSSELRNCCLLDTKT